MKRTKKPRTKNQVILGLVLVLIVAVVSIYEWYFVGLSDDSYGWSTKALSIGAPLMALWEISNLVRGNYTEK